MPGCVRETGTGKTGTTATAGVWVGTMVRLIADGCLINYYDKKFKLNFNS